MQAALLLAAIGWARHRRSRWILRLSSLRGSNRSYYLFDGLGSVVAVTNSSGSVTNSYTYPSASHRVKAVIGRISAPCHGGEGRSGQRTLSGEVSCPAGNRRSWQTSERHSHPSGTSERPPMFWAFTSTAWRSWLFMAVTFGGFAGVRGGLETGSVRFGLVSGAISGILFATLMLLIAVRRSLSTLRHLPGDDRVAVIRAIRRGGSVHDPRSAEALIAYAGELRHQYESPFVRSGRALFAVLAVLSIIVVIEEIVQGNAVGAIGNVVLAIAWAIAAAGWPWWRERTADRMESAVASAQHLLDSQRGTTGQGSWS